MMKTTKRNEGTRMDAKIAACSSPQELAVLCQDWADGRGIELEGTYLEIARKNPGTEVGRIFSAMAARARRF